MDSISKNVGCLLASLTLLALSGCVSTVKPAALPANNPTSESATEGRQSRILLDDTFLSNSGQTDPSQPAKEKEGEHEAHSHMHMKGHSHE